MKIGERDHGVLCRSSLEKPLREKSLEIIGCSYDVGSQGGLSQKGVES